MPTISQFLGIRIKMYYKDHQPPHFHADYGRAKGMFDIESGQMLKGTMPEKQARNIQIWAKLHREELLANWELAHKKLAPCKIEPLK